MRLFVERARASQPRFALTAENAATIAAICRQVDGLPLAIELAAARLRVLSADALLAGLEHRLRLLTGGPRDVPDRLRTMRHAISWSYELLTDEERVLFRRLAVFIGGFTLEAAEDVGGEGGDGLSALGGKGGLQGEAPRRLSPFPPSPPSPPERSDTPSSLDLITSLVDKSLLQRVEQDGETRFTMLETIREFAWEMLAGSDDLDAVVARHAAWCMHLAAEARRSGALSRNEGLVRLEAEHPHLRAALGWLLTTGDTTAALSLAGSLAEFWLRRGHVSEGIAWLERALAADDGPPTAPRANALVGLNMLLWTQSSPAGTPGAAPLDDETWDQFTLPVRLLDEAEAVARATGDAGTLAYVRLHQGYVAAFRGDWAVAEARGQEALTTAATIPQEFSLHGALWLLAWAAYAQGDDDQAMARSTHLLALAQASGDAISCSNTLFGLATMAEQRGEPFVALRGFADAAISSLSYGDHLHAGLCVEHAATTVATLGHAELAARLFAAAEAMQRIIVGEHRSGVYVTDRQGYQQALTDIRAELGPERFATLWTRGGKLSINTVIAEIRALATMESASDVRTSETPGSRLTPRERDVVRLLVEGCSDKEIAAALGLGRRTVSNYVAEIRSKLAAPSRSAAAAIAVRNRLV